MTSMTSFSIYIWAAYAVTIGLLSAATIVVFVQYQRAKKDLVQAKKKQPHET